MSSNRTFRATHLSALSNAPALSTCSLHFGDIISLYCESTIEHSDSNNAQASGSNALAFKKAKSNFKFKSSFGSNINSSSLNNEKGQKAAAKRKISGFISTLGLVDERVVVQPAAGTLDNPPVRFRDCMFRILPQSRYNARKQHWRSLQSSQAKIKDEKEKDFDNYANLQN